MIISEKNYVQSKNFAAIAALFVGKVNQNVHNYPVRTIVPLSYIFLYKFLCFFFQCTSKVVRIDLTNESFIPGKKNYERIRIALEERLTQKFDVIVSWDPPGSYTFTFLKNTHNIIFVSISILYIYIYIYRVSGNNHQIFHR